MPAKGVGLFIWRLFTYKTTGAFNLTLVTVDWHKNWYTID